MVMQTARVSSCNENFVSIRLSLELRSLQESVRLQTPSHLTAPTCSGSTRSDIVECMQPAMYRVSTGSAKPRSFHGALTQSQSNKKAFNLAVWRPYLALEIETSLSQQRSFAQTSFSPWTVMGAV